MSKKFSIITALLAIGISSIIAFYIANKAQKTSERIVYPDQGIVTQVSSKTTSKSLAVQSFTLASKKSTPCVVFIKTESTVVRRNIFSMFSFDPFGSIGEVASSGSGVIIAKDGYIVTNHHVVKNANTIEVVLNNQKRTYQAEVLGVAPSSDLALLKIDATNLSTIEIANSDDLEIGAWVLAVGNPFNLTSTVTAGIVSAKGRNINLLNNSFPIESFIQTDAVINPGNSGGALVDTDGKLVGINTSIMTKTGSYVGYGFAIPSNIVVKIVNDLKEYGEIQRGFDGIDVIDIDEELSQKLNGLNNGVEITKIRSTNPDSKSHLKEGDIILKINEKAINNKAEYDEQLANYRPGNLLNYSLLRNGEKIIKEIKLINMNGDYEMVKTENYHSELLGADLRMLNTVEKDLYQVEGGIVIKNSSKGMLRGMNLQDESVILEVNGKTFADCVAFEKYMIAVKGQIKISELTPEGHRRNHFYYSR